MTAAEASAATKVTMMAIRVNAISLRRSAADAAWFPWSRPWNDADCDWFMTGFIGVTGLAPLGSFMTACGAVAVKCRRHATHSRRIVLDFSNTSRSTDVPLGPTDDRRSGKRD